MMQAHIVSAKATEGVRKERLLPTSKLGSQNMNPDSKNEVQFLRDEESLSYSINCQSCGTTTSHNCQDKEKIERLQASGIYFVGRDKTDSVYHSHCVYCAGLDISPFIADIEESIADHETFHTFLEEIDVDPSTKHELDLFVLWAHHADCLEGDESERESRRWGRVSSWSSFIMRQYEVEA